MNRLWDWSWPGDLAARTFEVYRNVSISYDVAGAGAPYMKSNRRPWLGGVLMRYADKTGGDGPPPAAACAMDRDSHDAHRNPKA